MLDISSLQVTKRYEDDTTTGAFDVTYGTGSLHIKPFKGNESSVIMEFVGAQVFKAISNLVCTFTPAEVTLAIHNGQIVSASRMFANFHSISTENKKIKSSVGRRKRNDKLEYSYPFFFICSEDDRSAGNVGMDDPISMIDFGRFCYFYGNDVRKIVRKFFTLWNDGNMYDPTKYPEMKLDKVIRSLQQIDGDFQATIFSAIDAAIGSLKQVTDIEIASINFTFKDIDADTHTSKTFETFEGLENHIKTQIAFNILHVLPALIREVQLKTEMENQVSSNICLRSIATPPSTPHSASALSVVSSNLQSVDVGGIQKRRRIAMNLFAQDVAVQPST